VDKFGKAAKEVSTVLADMEQAMSKVEELVNLSEADPEKILLAFNEYFRLLVDKLGGLVDKIPGLGAFIIIWTEAIEQIRVSVMATRTEVIKRNKIMQEVFGEDLYQTFQTDRQQRAQEMVRLKGEIEALNQQVAEHPDNPGIGAVFGSVAAEPTQDPRVTDVKAARDSTIRDVSPTRR